MGLQLIVEDEICQGHGRCYMIHAPEALHADDDGFVIPRDQLITVAAEHEAQAREAVSGCPERAIQALEV
jgi:ferredoxin